MTAIVAVKDPGSGRVIVGGDSFSGTYEYALETATPKVFTEASMMRRVLSAVRPSWA